MPIVTYLSAESGGAGYRLAYTLAGPDVLVPTGAGAAAVHNAEQAALQAAGQQGLRKARNAYSPQIIKAGWGLTTRTVPDLVIEIRNREPLALWVEEPTQAHNIPGAFGYPPPFGTLGRFAGKFHPGTKGKHRLPALLAHLGQSFEQQVDKRVTPLLRGEPGPPEGTE